MKIFFSNEFLNTFLFFFFFCMQKINHFPGMAEICRKDLLARNLNRMSKLFPKDYDFSPRTWLLPIEYVILLLSISFKFISRDSITGNVNYSGQVSLRGSIMGLDYDHFSKLNCSHITL